MISSLAIIPAKVVTINFDRLLTVRSTCKEYMPIIAELENRPSFNLNEEVIKGEIMRYKADSFQEVMRKRGVVTGNLLLAALGMNVAGLAAMSLFLKFDSEDLN